MTAYSIYEARNRFSELVSSVESGLEVTITKHGREVARLVPAQPRKGAGRTGADVVQWLEENPLPPESRRSSEDIEAGIEENRNAWE